ncbi:MAG: hypothetical protein HN750_16265, partial [Gemmatimonadales bacterium]|nr:hypothetical protein [Gemmatimonadales bacterium]
IASQGFLGFCLAGHLLFESRIRVLPTLSHPETLRLQPSAFITDEQIDTFLEAVDHVCAILERDRGDQLIGFLCADEGVRFAKAEETVKGSTSARSARIARIRPTRPQRASVIPPYAGRVAFLGHFIRPGHLRHWDPGLGDFDDDALARFVDRTHRLLEPYVSDGAIIESVVGERVHMSFIGIPITPMQIHRAFENGNIRWVEEKILEGVRLGRRQGASLVGMGGYTSILTGQGTRVSEDRVGITSGNAMTVAMGVEALIRTAKDVKIDLSTARLGALGATGNICSLYAQMMAELVPKIALIGRPHMESRLRRVAGEVYFETYKVVRRAGDKKLRGLAKVLQGTETFKQVLSAEADLDRIGTSIYNWISNEMGDDAPITIHSDPSGLKDCNLIVAASSFPGPVIFPQHLGPGPRVICDLALPEDTSPEVLAQRPDVKVIRGGIVKLPNNPDLELAGVPLEPGCVFACMAETLLLGLSRINEHFSWGRVTKPHVEAIRDLATYHGFTLSRPSMTSVL